MFAGSVSFIAERVITVIWLMNYCYGVVVLWSFNE